MPTPGRFRPRQWRANADARWHGPWDPEIASGRFSGRSPQWVRLWGPVVISLFVQVPTSLFRWRVGARPEFVAGDDLALTLGLALVGPAALLFARRFPGPVVAVVALAASIDLLLSGNTDGPPYIALAFAIGSAIVRGARVWAWVSIGVAWFATIVLSTFVGVSWQPWRIAGITIGILLVVAAAEGVRTQKERVAEFGRRIAVRRQAEVQAERVRIARELHDVLAHSLSQINVQAGVGLHLMERQPDKAAEALANIKETSKTALDEVRAVLGILRAETGGDPSAPLVPEPDLSRLAGLAASVTSQGIEVDLDNALGDVPQATQLAIYRIVQESLTNVVRHSRATRARVELRETPDRYDVRVTDDGTGPQDHTERDSEPGGRGLLGMHERAELLGGTLDAGPLPGGGFGVAASIPKKTPREDQQ
ncbi:signal transduction histidine kinase [Conyzicola lurida]|uniref:histidine kinase n=1 Tax=Conyzicola lurida TaxID=1172621 RepID=A0A841AN50_9MICO|nr:sensor histidine kinase [Conyzicola lurida]MBB5843372.1 signal transduction histidine kinase [Conyzicola lurida]